VPMAAPVDASDSEVRLGAKNLLRK